MAPPTSLTVASRVLVLAPFGRDAEVLCRILWDGGLVCDVCHDSDELTARVNEGAGALLITSEVLTSAALERLESLLASQPSWSDLPIVVLVSSEELGSAVESPITRLHRTANVTLLERPTRGFTLLTVLRSALRARARQYQTRDLLDKERTARAEADRANRSKDEFLATVSHELGTPLSAILLWSRLAMSGGNPGPELMKTLANIHESASAQSILVEDLLDAARIASGKLQLMWQQAQLAPSAEKAVNIVRPSAEAKGVRLETNIDTSAGFVRADPARIRQVIWNLLINAVKFTPANGVVQLTLKRDGDTVMIQVTDSGRGIDHTFLPRVFERFSQADGQPNRTHGGLGLGLAISKELIEMHGGTITVESPGLLGGATFRIRIPLQTS